MSKHRAQSPEREQDWEVGGRWGGVGRRELECLCDTEQQVRVKLMERRRTRSVCIYFSSWSFSSGRPITSCNRDKEEEEEQGDRWSIAALSLEQVRASKKKNKSADFQLLVLAKNEHYFHWTNFQISPFRSLFSNCIRLILKCVCTHSNSPPT